MNRTATPEYDHGGKRGGSYYGDITPQVFGRDSIAANGRRNV